MNRLQDISEITFLKYGIFNLPLASTWKAVGILSAVVVVGNVDFKPVCPFPRTTVVVIEIILSFCSWRIFFKLSLPSYSGMESKTSIPSYRIPNIFWILSSALRIRDSSEYIAINSLGSHKPVIHDTVVTFSR